MLHRHLLGLGLALGASLAAATLSAHSGGPNNGLAAQPGNYANCTQCHSTNAVNAGDGAMSVQGVPASYMPGQTYRLTVTLEDPGQSRWGFELVALDQSDANAGGLTSVDGNTQTSIDSAGRIFAKQTRPGTFAGTSNGPVSWDLDWTAPAAGTGTVSFFAAGNAANNNNGNSGDFIYTAASAAAEAGAGKEATVVVQPDDPSVKRNDTFRIRARVRNHAPAADNLVVVSRLILPTGNTFPSVGWLLPPAAVALVPEGQETVDLLHPVPATAPLITATYQVLTGRAPATLLSTDSFTLTVLP